MLNETVIFSCVDITQWELCIYGSVGVEVIFLENNIISSEAKTLFQGMP